MQLKKILAILIAALMLFAFGCKKEAEVPAEKPAEAKPEVKPAEVKPAEAKPAEEKPAEKPAEPVEKPAAK